MTASDPLTDVLRTIKLSGAIFLRAALGGRYGVEMPPPTISHPVFKPATREHRLVMFHIVREGNGYLEVEGAEPQAIHNGDLIVILADLAHSVVDTPGRSRVNSADVVANFTDSSAPPVANIGDGPPTMRLVCGMLQFVERGLSPLVAALPPYLVISRDAGPSSEWLQACINHILKEAEAGRPGSDVSLARLTEVLFVETIRSYLERLPASERGWLAALKDPMVGAAVQLMHQAPAQAWTVASLARKVGVSRSAFSARFTELLDISPISYLYRWRIRLATNLLDETELSPAEIAQRVGYESESAFNRAFKRELGTPPAAWRKRFSGKGALA